MIASAASLPAGGDYDVFVAAKAHVGTRDGFKPLHLPDFLFGFQRALVEWAVEQGRSAIFADCGLGKTPMQLVWADNVVRHANKPVLVLTPLAVSAQTVAEAEKFQIDARWSREGRAGSPAVVVTNYEKLHLFEPGDFAGAVCDESSILKDFEGARRQQITDFMRKLRYRLLCTATAAPNDYMELGTSSEALGYLGHVDMLGRFFKNEQGKGAASRRAYGKAVQFRLRAHAERAFWQWVCSWSRAVRRPSDLGFADEGFVLPPLVEREHVVGGLYTAPGEIFPRVAVTMQEQREEQRRTLVERCEQVASLVDHGNPALVWCQLNPEGDLLEKLIPGAVQVSGSDSDERKEERFMAFARGEARVLVTKPKIGAWGLNFQHCSHVTFFPSHSFEQYYQGVRRCWRFGQKESVQVDMVTTEGGRNVLNNLQKKAARADAMFARLVALMNDALAVQAAEHRTPSVEVPSWL